MQFKVFLKPCRQRGSIAFLAYPFSLWHLLSLLFVSFCLQLDFHVQEHKDRLKIISVLCTLFRAWEADYGPFYISHQDGARAVCSLRAGELAAESNTTASWAELSETVPVPPPLAREQDRPRGGRQFQSRAWIMSSRKCVMMGQV